MDLQAYRGHAVSLVIITSIHHVHLAFTTESDRCFLANTGLSSGCSIPLFKKFPYKRSFTPPCQRHDICYSCARKFSITRLYCDDIFLQDMLNVCDMKKSFWKRVGCKYFARRVYYRSVRTAGSLFFKTTPKAECNKSWVSSCFP